MELAYGSLIANLALITGIWYLAHRAGRTRRGFGFFLMRGVQIGPQTVVQIMSRADLFYSGLRMVAWGLIFLSIWVVDVLVMAGFASQVEPHNFFVAVVVLSALFAAMCFVKALYFFVRGTLRRRGLV